MINLRISGLRAAILAAFAGFSFALPAAAFPEKNITFVIPYNPGGGFDLTARSLVPVLEKYLPKKVNILPRNLPGAGGSEGASAVYRARPDGYTIGIFNIPGFAIPAAMGQSVGFDLKKITWLGRVEATYYVLAVNAHSAYRSLEDLAHAGHPIKFTATGYGSTALAAAQIGAKVLGIDAAFVPGYQGGPEYLVALVRGDGEAAMAIREIGAKYIEAGELRPLLSFEPDKSSFAGVPRAADAGFPELDGLGLERVIGAPPALDPQARDILAKALAQTLQDPDFVALAAKVQIDLAPLDADGTSKRVQNSIDFYEKYKDVIAAPN